MAASTENTGESSGSFSRAGHSAHSASSEVVTPSAVPYARPADDIQTSSGATQTIGTGTDEHPAQRAQAHDAVAENPTGAATVVPTQPMTAGAADAAARTLLTAHVTTPGASHAQGIGAAPLAAPQQDTFAALDRETSLGAPTWTHAAGLHAEAGFRDPDLGWVGVRADLNASGIHATLVPSSADAAQTLGSHLTGLGSHLAEEHAPVASLSMASPGDGGAESGAGQRMQQGTESNADQNRSDQTAATSPRNGAANSSASAQAEGANNAASQEGQAYLGELRGTRISVMA